MSLPFVNRAAWIWSAEGTHAKPAPGASSPSHYEVRLFRRTFDVPDPALARLDVHVSADSRYLLFCNGTLVGRGPAKGDVTHQFYESLHLTPRLRPGRNVLAALVLDMSRVAHRPAWLGAPCSVMTYAGGFVLEGELTKPPSPKATARPGAKTDGVIEDLSTGLDGWKVAVDTAHRFQNESTTFEGYQGYFEHRVSKAMPRGWTEAAFDDRDWAPATVLYKAERLENRRDPTSPYGLMPRMIPPLEEAAATEFQEVFLPGEGKKDAAASARRPHRVEANTRTELIFDAGELTTGYPVIEVVRGAGAVVRLTYAEALRLPWDTPGAKLLGRRQSLANLASHFADETTGWTFDRRGKITGWRDVWEPAGDGTAERPERFEPLHWRTFRFVGLQVEAGDAPLEIHFVGHRFTAYPYTVAAEFACSDPRLDRIWEVALWTMRLCSHETFEDCPYYEQMQYAGDTMITAKIAMLATGDYRLARQAILHFDWSRISDGLTQSRYPSRLLQVIPSWSLHWITNVRDYVYCSGDVATARHVLHGVKTVLDWFRRHADADGLPAQLPFWNITDWCSWWPRGVVPGADAGPTCIISAQYIVGLEAAAELCELVGAEESDRGRSRSQAAEFRAEAATLKTKLHARFWSEAEGLYFDRPGGPELSQYGNAWAVICGAAGERERQRMLARFPHDPKLAPGSFFWWHAGFRALERCGAYERMPEFLGPWHEMVDHGLSTFAEENSYWRSLCHAWSAHPGIEFLTRVLGVAPVTPGFGRIGVAPQLCGLDHARGVVCTPRGLVRVDWRVEKGRFAIEIDAPRDTPVRVRLPGAGAEEREFGGGTWRAEVVL